MVEFEYSIELSDRKTLAVSVLPDGGVCVRAPLDTSPEEIASRVKKRAKWIRAQLAYFERFSPRTPPRRYVPGESHPYRGRKYRLRVLEGTGPVRICGPYLEVPTRDSSPLSVARRLDAWYRAEAARIFPPLIASEWRRFGYQVEGSPRLVIKKLTRRWGSLSKSGILTLNLDLIKVPRSCAEYVICHELCHHRYADHGEEFYPLLRSMLSDWEDRKRRLERFLL